MRITDRLNVATLRIFLTQVFIFLQDEQIFELESLIFFFFLNLNRFFSKQDRKYQTKYYKDLTCSIYSSTFILYLRTILKKTKLSQIFSFKKAVKQLRKEEGRKSNSNSCGIAGDSISDLRRFIRFKTPISLGHSPNIPTTCHCCRDFLFPRENTLSRINFV